MKKTTNQSGSTLMSVLMIVMVAVAVVGAAYLTTAGQVMLTSRSADIDALQATSEGVLDYAYGQWKNQVDTQGLWATTGTGGTTDFNWPSLVATQPAVPYGMTIDSLTLTPVDALGMPSTSVVQLYDYKMSFIYNFAATVRMHTSGVGGTRYVTMRRIFCYTAVPPTRGMFYSEGDFELYKPAKMVIGGDVHTNANAHISTGTAPTYNSKGVLTSTALEFLPTSKVTYVGSYDNSAPAGALNWSDSGSNYPPTYDTGISSQVQKVPQVTGIGAGTAAQYNTTDSNPNNDGNRELIEPPVAGYDDPAAIAASRLYNTAGLLISVSGPVDSSAALTASGSTFSGGNFSVKAQNGTTLTAAQAAVIRNAVTNSKVTPTQVWVPKLVQVTTQVWVSNWVQVKGKWVDQGGYVNQTTTVDQGAYVTQNVVTQTTIYDKREVANIPISNLNLGAIVPTLNSLTEFNGIIYMYDNGAGDQKAIRVTNGGVLPNGGLTIATEDGLYVQGDYNTGTTTNSNLVPSNASPAANASTVVPGYTTKSAALVGDAIMVLSNGWSDANASSGVSSRNATNTTVNTAFIGGYIPSVDGGNNGRSGYSGGMNNFPRFLENWSGDSMTFSGAFVSLYQSKKFTGSWDTGDIYSPPTRYWYFDTMLLSRVLPGIPPSGGCIRGALTRINDKDRSS